MQAVTGISPIDTSFYGNETKTLKTADNQNAFDSLLQSAMNLIDETNTLTNKAEEEEMRYAMGESESLHELQVAQQKANISLQYTVAIRNAVLDAYRDIINLQF